MRLTRMQLKLLQEGLELLIADAEETLEHCHNNRPVCQWANETIDDSSRIHEKLQIVIETIQNLEERSCDADIILTPRIKPSPHVPIDP